MAIANGEFRREDTLELLLAMGLEEGLTDLALILPAGRLRWLEVKLEQTLIHERTAPNRVQRELHDELRWLDHEVDVIRSLDDLLAILAVEDVPHTLSSGPRQEAFRLRGGRR